METLNTKRCSGCSAEKSLDDFHFSGSSKDGRHSRCKACKSVAAKGQYQRWTPEQRELHRTRVLRSRYGMDLELLKQLYEKQEGCCAICGKPGDRPAVNEKRKSHAGVLCVDHDHDTGEVRGLLCTNCNVGLGRFESVSLLVKAAAYLEREGD